MTRSGPGMPGASNLWLRKRRVKASHRQNQHRSRPARKPPPLAPRRNPPCPRALPPVNLAAPVLFDRRTEQRFRDGAIRIEARIDLHGMRQDAAYAALAVFLAAQVAAGRRKLLIITGQGRGKAGVLRSNLPGWLETLAAARHIIDLRPAAPRHGGDGAFYVWLRKAGMGAKG